MGDGATWPGMGSRHPRRIGEPSWQRALLGSLVCLTLALPAACSDAGARLGRSEILSLPGSEVEGIVEPADRVARRLLVTEERWEDRGPIPSFGFGVGVVWVRLSLANAHETPQRLVVFSKTPWVDSHHMFAFDREGREIARATTGDRVSDGGAVLRFLQPAFALTVPAKQTIRLLVRYESRGSIVVPVLVLSEEDAFAHMRQEYGVQVAILAAFWLLVLFGAGFYGISGYKPMGFFALLMLANAGVHVVLSGLAGDLIRPRKEFLLNEGLLCAGSLVGAAALAFARSFLGSRERLTWTDTVLRVAMWVFLVGAAVALVPPFYPAISAVLTYAAGLVLLLPLACGVWLAFQKVSGAVTLAIGNGFAVVGVITEALSTSGLLPQSYLGLMGIRTGLLVGGLWFAVALGLRLREGSAARVRAQVALERVDRELAAAQSIYARLLPEAPPLLPGAEIFARQKTNSRLGGDFYAFESSGDGRQLFFLADASGRGLAAALDCSLVRVALRRALAQTWEPVEILEHMNAFLEAHLEERLVSAVCARLDPEQRRLLLATAGHPQAILVDERGTTVIPTRGPLLGVGSQWGFDGQEVSARPGTYLMLYTNGLVARRATDELPHPQAALLEACPSAGSLRGGELADTLMNRALELHETRAPHDDITLLVVDFR